MPVLPWSLQRLSLAEIPGFTLCSLSLTAWRTSAPSCVCALYWGPQVSGESINYILTWQRETPPSVPLRSMHKNDGKILPLFSSSDAGERCGAVVQASHCVGIRKPQPSKGRKCGVVEKTHASVPQAWVNCLCHPDQVTLPSAIWSVNCQDWRRQFLTLLSALKGEERKE